MFGSRLVFQIGVVVHGLAMGAIAFSTSARAMIQVQGVAGLAAAVLVPALVVLIASNYKGKQQSQALGLLGAAQASAGVLAFLVVGTIGALVGWRSRSRCSPFSRSVVFLLSFRLKPVERQPDDSDRLDRRGPGGHGHLAHQLRLQQPQRLGLLLAGPGAPFDVLGLSPGADS